MSTIGGTNNPWLITAADRAKHDQQFFALIPLNGLITGDQARTFFMQSGLPPNILAQIWGLADINKDGKMDRKEFSIAMHLIQKKLQGFTLPTALPESLKADPAPAFGVFGSPPVGVAAMPMGGGAGTWSGGMMTGGVVGAPATPPIGFAPAATGGMPINMGPAMGIGASPPRVEMSGAGRSTTTDWSMPQQVKLRHMQMFNQLDKSHAGSLTGAHARNILSQSLLPTQVLAQVWSLADVDKDGRLNAEEYCIAMHLVEMYKSGHTPLPLTTPAELLPGGRARPPSRNESPTQAYSDEPPPQKNSSFQSFEDRRRDNFDKGQAELEKRRQVLMEQEKRMREERERKERVEMERQERERQEAERRRQLEHEKEMARQRELELQRQEEQRKMMEQREAARRQLEQQRQQELERQRVRELTAQRQQEMEMTQHAKQRQKNLTFQLQALNEKSTELNQLITNMRDKIVHVTGDIETMKRDRDTKVTDIERLKNETQQAQLRVQQLSHEKLQVQSDHKAASSFSAAETLVQVDQALVHHRSRLNQLNSDLTGVKQDVQQKVRVIEDRRAHLRNASNTHTEATAEYRRLAEQVQAKQAEARQLMQRRRISVEQKTAAQAAAAAALAAQQKASHNAHPVNNGDAAAWGATATPAADAFGFDDNFGSAPFGQTNGAGGTTGNAPLPSAADTQPGGAATARYRALYEFSARSADELSFQPGDVILVFKDHIGEAGWLAGQIRDTVGWFPEAFAECIDGEATSAKTSTPAATTVSPSAEPLPSINEESFEREEESGQSAAQAHARSDGPNESEDRVKNTPLDSAGQALIAVAQYPWKARKDTHLTFAKGDKILIVEQQEMWWQGELNGKAGWFPKSYVKLSGEVGKAPALPPKQASVDKGPSSPIKSTAAAAAAAPTAGEYYTAIYPFAAPEPDDLKFEAGDRILVTQQDGDWWTGTIDDRSGIFPATYVQKADAASADAGAESAPHQRQRVEREEQVNGTKSPATAEVYEIGKAIATFDGDAENQLSLRPGDLVRIRSKSPAGWWEGELQRPGQERTIGWFPGNYVQVIGSNSGDAESTPAATGKPPAADGAGELVFAIFDYASQQEDELTFQRDDAITVLEKQDESWWRGRLADGREGLFPANYVQPRSMDAPPPTPHENVPNDSATQDSKFAMHAQELVDTERNFYTDLCMVRDVFIVGLERGGAVEDGEIERLFINWPELISVAKALHSDLKKRPKQPGQVILDRIDSLQVFVRFCERQQAAIEFLTHKEATNAKFAAVYQRCCQHPSAKGLPLSYFLLLPMGRVTKYPLVLEKLIKYSTPQNNPDYENLESAHQMLKALCSEVNHVVTEVENLQMLYWSQHHIRCDSMRPKLVFASQTNACGPRKFIHSGVLYKARSGRLLIALLFNDMLMLCSPDEAIDRPDSFKLSKSSDVMITLYKTPIPLKRAALQIPQQNTGSSDDNAKLFSISTGDDVISFRAVNSNARILWTRQLDKTIQACQEMTVLDEAAGRKSSSRGVGRLLVEVVCVRHLVIPAELGTTPGVVCRMSTGGQKQVKALDLSKKDTLCSTQFTIDSHSAIFTLAVELERLFVPDLCAGRIELPIGELIRSSGTHRGPILRQIPLTHSQVKSDEKSFVILKFVIQMFD